MSSALIGAFLAMGLAIQPEQGAAPQGVGDTDAGAAFRKSAALAEESVRRWSNDPRLRIVLGDVLDRSGRLQEARDAFDRAAAIEPRLPEAVLRAAQLRARLGEGEAALLLFRDAIARGAPSVRHAARAGLCDVLTTVNRYAEAAAVMKESIADGDTSAEAHFLLGKALDREAFTLPPEQKAAKGAALAEAARLALIEALKRDPGHSGARYVLAMLFARTGKTAESREQMAEFRRARAAKERVDREQQERLERSVESRTLLDLARAHLKSGRKEEGAALCLKAAEARRVFPEAYELLSGLALEHGVLIERAVEFAQRAAEQRPSPENFVKLAIALHTAGKLAESEAVVRMGLARFPGNPDLLQSIGFLQGGAPAKP